VAWLRAAFVVGALLGGLGIALYLACWLIVPEQGDGEDRRGTIGVRLGISARTVESHVGAVLRKLQLSSRHEVTHWAAARGLIEPAQSEPEHSEPEHSEPEP
jgi:hypothetical protein